MDGSGIVTWLVVSLILAAAAAAILQFRQAGSVSHYVAYVLPAALLGAFMGSEAFKENWRFIGSEKGPEVGGYFIITSIIFGIFITIFAGLAALMPAPAREEIER